MCHPKWLMTIPILLPDFSCFYFVVYINQVSKRRILNVPLSTWRALEKLLSDRNPLHEQLLAYGWHLLFGQPAVLAHRTMSRH